MSSEIPFLVCAQANIALSQDQLAQLLDLLEFAQITLLRVANLAELQDPHCSAQYVERIRQRAECAADLREYLEQ